MNYVEKMYQGGSDIMNMIFLGPPGTGKGTYSTRVALQLGIPHISTGDMFRDAIKQGNELGKKVSAYVHKGALVPDHITIEVLGYRINRSDCKNGFVLDGYPRTINQAEALDKVAKIDVVINLVMPDKVLIKKMMARRVCEKCGDTYNIADIQGIVDGIKFNMPPLLPKNDERCDKCGGRLIQRKDDTEEVIKERLNVYKNQTEPLEKYYRDKGLIRDVLVNAGPEVMVPKIMNILKEEGLA
jgi:adenylate kinase